MKDSITLYSLPTCPKCRALKMKLGQAGLSYKENNDIDVMTSKGISNLPMLEVNGKLMSMAEAMKWIGGCK